MPSYEDQEYLNSPRRAEGKQLTSSNISFYASLYENLQDTTHSNQGRPLYLCTRQHFHSKNLSNHFRIVGKTRTNDVLIRPQGNTPDRPSKTKHKSHKKHKAPKPGNAQTPRSNLYRSDSQNLNGYVPRYAADANAKVSAQYRSSDKSSTHYVNGSQGSGNGRPYIVGESYSSLPRDGGVRSDQTDGKRLKRTPSAAERVERKPNQLNEQQFADVMKKNSLNGGLGQPTSALAGRSVSRRIIYYKLLQIVNRIESFSILLPTCKINKNSLLLKSSKKKRSITSSAPAISNEALNFSRYHKYQRPACSA